MLSSGPWCPVIFVPHNGEVMVFTTRCMTIARREKEIVDFPVSVQFTEDWFHHLFIQTCYVQLKRH